MIRSITGFVVDDRGDWVARLSCFHRQHVRHRPPFQDRSWVLSEDGRASRLGAGLDCPLCDRAELPDGLRVVRSAGPFDQDTVPPGLTRSHRVPEGLWGVLTVTDGQLRLSMPPDGPGQPLRAGQTHALPPGVPHRLLTNGPVSFRLDLYDQAADA